MVFKLADPCNLSVVVKNLDKEKMDFPREQKPGDQGVYPISPPMVFQKSQIGCYELSWFRIKL
jgi:hypothetical protein